MQLPPRRSAGFTLIELMIVVAILGILSAVAYPSYQNYIRKSRRADAHALLQAAALAQEKYRINHTTYYPGGAANGTGTTIAEFKGVCIVVGTTCNSPDGYYRLSSATAASPADQTGYTLTATPQGSQAQDTACATITLGVSAGVTSYGPTNKCWNK